MKQTYIIKHKIAVSEIRMMVQLAVVAVTAYFVYRGFYLILLPSAFTLFYSLLFKAVDIDFGAKTYHEYTSILGLKMGERGTLANIQAVMVKDTRFLTRTRSGGTESDDCYEVALVGDDRFKLVLLYSYDKTETIKCVWAVHQKLGYPIHDLTHEQLMGDRADIS